ncbi:hypothetical protein [Actinomadura flavalba]|uniref:hypothetical protein n=1 Tax=Actinomadura flavalba TaxID=1120938 RepID=UPI0003601453|nr:hypothetical protein [Actinomadura flavalba]
MSLIVLIVAIVALALFGGVIALIISLAVYHARNPKGRAAPRPPGGPGREPSHDYSPPGHDWNP